MNLGLHVTVTTLHLFLFSNICRPIYWHTIQLSTMAANVTEGAAEFRLRPSVDKKWVANFLCSCVSCLSLMTIFYLGSLKKLLKKWFTLYWVKNWRIKFLKATNKLQLFAKHYRQKSKTKWKVSVITFSCGRFFIRVKLRIEANELNSCCRYWWLWL